MVSAGRCRASPTADRGRNSASASWPGEPQRGVLGAGIGWWIARPGRGRPWRRTGIAEGGLAWPRSPPGDLPPTMVSAKHRRRTRCSTSGPDPGHVGEGHPQRVRGRGRRTGGGRGPLDRVVTDRGRGDGTGHPAQPLVHEPFHGAAGPSMPSRFRWAHIFRLPVQRLRPQPAPSRAGQAHRNRQHLGDRGTTRFDIPGDAGCGGSVRAIFQPGAGQRSADRCDPEPASVDVDELAELCGWAQVALPARRKSWPPSRSRRSAATRPAHARAGLSGVLPVHARHHLACLGALLTHPPTQRPSRDPHLRGDMPPPPARHLRPRCSPRTHRPLTGTLGGLFGIPVSVSGRDHQPSGLLSEALGISKGRGSAGESARKASRSAMLSVSSRTVTGRPRQRPRAGGRGGRSPASRRWC